MVKLTAEPALIRQRAIKWHPVVSPLSPAEDTFGIFE